MESKLKLVEDALNGKRGRDQQRIAEVAIDISGTKRKRRCDDEIHAGRNVEPGNHGFEERVFR